MTGHRAVLAVGPAAVEALCCAAAAPAGAAAALEFFDDPIALHDDTPVRTESLLRRVLAEAGHGGAPVLIHPTWWPGARVDRLAAAAPGATLIPRRRLLAAAVRSPATLVEIGPELVAITTDGTVAEPRLGAPATVADAVAGHCAAAGATVVIDVPTGVGGADALAGLIAGRSPGAVRRIDRAGLGALARTVTAELDRAAAELDRAAVAGPGAKPSPPRRAARRWPTAAAVLLTVVLLMLGVPRRTPAGPDPGPTRDATFLVEGRVAVAVPPDWVPRRITAGPGSARVEVTDPADPRRALQLTQAPAAGTRLADVAAVLRAALARAAAPTVFVDFDPRATVAGRAAISYREVRAGRTVDWTVLLDGATQIGIGCQAPPDGAAALRVACERAVASAHTVSQP